MYKIGYRITFLSCLLHASTMLLHVRTYIRISALSPCYITEHVILPMTGPDHVSKAFWCVTLSVPGGGGGLRSVFHTPLACVIVSLSKLKSIAMYTWFICCILPHTNKIVGNRCTVNPVYSPILSYCTPIYMVKVHVLSIFPHTK